MANQEDREAFEYRRNPPKFADQGDSTMSSFDSFGGGSGGGDEPNPFGGGGDNPYQGSSGSPSTGGDPFGSFGGFGSSTPGSAFGAPTMPGQMDPQQSKQNRSSDEVFFDSIVGGAKGIGRGSKAFGASLAESNAAVFAKTGNKAIRFGLGFTVFGGIVMLLSLFLPLHNGLGIACGGLVSSMVGLVIFGSTYDKAKSEQSDVPSSDLEPDMEVADDGFIDMSDASIDDSEDDFFDSGDIDDGWIEDDDDFIDDDEPPEPELTVDEAKDRLSEMSPGMQTREHLFERYSMVLPNMTPNYDNWEQFTTDDDEFVDMETFLLEAAEVMGVTREDDMPVLETLRENPFVVEVVCERRNKSMKAEDTGKELARIYADRVMGSDDVDSCYARTTTSGRRVTILIFKGTSNVVVTLKDTYKEVRDWVRDTDVRMPVVLGVNEKGVVWKVDFSKLYSALISGMPRSGKSWETLAILLQIAMYCSPREVNFYIGDTKNDLSDYQNMNIPHIKEFAGTTDSILSMLEWVVNVEGPRRKKLIGSQADVNYNDFTARNPDLVSEMPRMYIIIDEMMALTSELNDDKELKSRFNSYLKTIVSQFPGMGIYFIGIPHRVNNNVIPKDVYALVPCNIAVMASENDIKNAIEATPREFPYTLTEPGESAMRISGVNKGKPIYSRGIAISSSNSQNREIMEFIRSMWSRLDHEYYHGPRQDVLDKKMDNFDDYLCGCDSHGGSHRVSGKKKNSKVDDSSKVGGRGILAGITGGYVEEVEDGKIDVTDDWADDDDVPVL